MRWAEDMIFAHDREWQRTGGSTKKCTTILLTLFQDTNSGVEERPSLPKLGGNDRNLVALAEANTRSEPRFSPRDP